MRFSTFLARARWMMLPAIVVLSGSVACSLDTILQNTASLGGSTPGDRGTVRLLFVNNTPFRAIFTYGTYDPDNTDFAPVFRQFFVDSTASNRLEGNSESTAKTLTCARVISLGGAEFIQRAKDATDNATQVAAASEEAFTPGIAFSDKPLNDAEAGQGTAGTAPAVETFLGTDFQCGSLVIYTFEVDDTQASGFRVDTQVVLP